MPKRFTDTDLWKKQRWFRKLTPEHKLVFCYIKDQCDHAGIWKIDCSELIDDLGLKEFDLNDFIESSNVEYNQISGDKEFKERISIVNNKFLWLTGFIQYQYENKCNKVAISAPVKTALLKLEGLSILYTSLSKGYITLTEGLQQKYLTLNDNCLTLTQDLQEGYVRSKDKDRDIVLPKEEVSNYNQNTKVRTITETYF